MRKNNLFRKAIAMIAVTCTLIGTTGFQGITAKAESFADYQIGQEIKKTFSNKKEKFLYKFTTDGTDSYYKLNFAKYGEGEGYAELAIYSSEDLEDSSKIEGFDAYTGDQGTVHDLVKKLKPNSTYYFKVTTTTESLNCKFSIEKYATDDHPDSMDVITPVGINTSVKGMSNHDQDVDYYSFKTDAAESFYKMNFKLVTLGQGYAYVDWVLYEDPEMTARVYESSVDGNSMNTADMTDKLKPNTVYYLAVTSVIDRYLQGEYTFTVSQTKDDVTKTGKSAKALTLNKSYKYGIQNKVDEDCFKFTTSAYTDYTITFKNTSKDAYVQMEIFKDASLVSGIKEIYLSGKSAINANDKKLSLIPGKTYYIKITGGEGAAYTLGINAAAPENNKAKSQTVKKKRQVTVSWGKISKATGYEIYRAVKTGSYKKVATVKSGKKVKWVDTKVKKGTTYKYKVRAYAKVKGKTYYSAYSAEKAVKFK